MWLKLIPSLFWLGLLCVACRQTVALRPPLSPQPPPTTLRLGLTSSAALLADLVTTPYAQQVAETHLQFIVANNRTLFADLAAAQLDAILVLHIPENSDVWFNPVALDGLVIVTHPDNPIQDLSLAEVQAIFNGRFRNWAAVGGPDQAVTLMSRESGAGTRLILNQRIMAAQRISINALIQPGDQMILAAVAADPAAIGYSMMGNAAGVSSLTIDAIPATPAETAAQHYPLTTPLYFVARVEPQDQLRLFLAWLQSEAGQVVIGERYGRVR